MNRSITNVIINLAASLVNENLPSLSALTARHFGTVYLSLHHLWHLGIFITQERSSGNHIYLQLLSNKNHVSLFFFFFTKGQGFD